MKSKANLATHEGEGYVLTKAGQALLTALQPLTTWAAKWGENLQDEWALRCPFQ